LFVILKETVENFHSFVASVLSIMVVQHCVKKISL